MENVENETVQEEKTNQASIDDQEQVKAEAKEEEVSTEEEKKEAKSEEESEDKEDVKLKEVKKEEEDYKAKYYYLAAEMENMTKRFGREKESMLKFGNEDLLKNMLDVLDNFDRSVDAIKNDEDEKVKNIVVGINMVQKQFLDVLSKFGLTEVETEGKEFDPNFHEAMGQQEVEGKKESEILQVFQKGYILNGRLLRAAKVMVAK